MKKITRPLRKIPVIREKPGLQTVQKMLEYSCATHSNHKAFSINKNGVVNSFTFNEVLLHVKKFAEHLLNKGLKKGDHIAILGENCPEWAISYFAVNWIGGVAIPLDSKAGVDEIKFILEFSDSKAMIMSDSFAEKASEINKSEGNLKYLINFQDIEKSAALYNDGIDSAETAPDDLCDILFTSGTTGNPKGVMLTNKNIMSNVEDIYSFLDLNTKDTAFSILPIHHSYERTCGLLATFYSGVHIFFARSIKPREMLEDIKLAKPTVWVNTPLVLEKLLLRIQRELKSQKGIKKLIVSMLPGKIIGKKIRKQLGLENIRLVVCGGAALGEFISDGMKKFGFPLIQGYGLSEASPLVSANPPSRPRNKSVGMIIESDEVEIRDPDIEGNGEIWVKGPNIMKGYFKNESETGKTLVEGWLNTGDIGYIDDESYLYITGRKKNVIVTKGGKNIFPEEIEEKLLKSPLISEALVFSPDDSQIQAIIFPDLDEINFSKNSSYDFSCKNEILEILDNEIKALNKTLLSHKKIARFAVRSEEFPKTTTRKIKRFCFKDMDLRNLNKFL